MTQTNNSDEMKEVVNKKGFFTSFARKGISTKITQIDELGDEGSSDSLYRQRAVVEVTAKIASGMAQKEFLPDDENGKEVFLTGKENNQKVCEAAAITPQTKQIAIAGPGDILSINSNAVMNFSPAAGSEGFSADYLPYIEFWDPDFAWRYTPAAPKGQKLRPWIALVVCETSKCDIQNNSNGNKIVTFKINSDDEYKSVFPPKKDMWKAAHAQGDSSDDARFCRLLGICGSLAQDTNYTAVVIPVFEVGRRRGIGFSAEKLKDVVAQASSWEDDLKSQTASDHPSPLSFPAYYVWNFKTGKYSFDTLVENLNVYEAEKTGIDVDVTSLGKGFTNVSENKTILMPAATKVPTSDPNKKNPAPFPDPKRKDEVDLYDYLKDLLDRSPVFVENKQSVENNKGDGENENDDPWVVPPIYGGKHSMALSFNHKDTPEWVRQVNLDLHYRAVAGLGKKTIQRYQEEFVNRAWKQVEAVQALNRTLYQRILSIGVNKSVKGKHYEWMKNPDGKAFISQFMQRLSTMQNTKSGGNGKSLNDILKNKGIPAAFASATFQRVTDRLAQKFKNLNLATMMDSIADRQIFNDEWHTSYNLPTIEQLATTKEALLSKMSDFIVGKVLGNYLKVCKGDCKDWKHFYGFSQKDGLKIGISRDNNHFCRYLDYSHSYTYRRAENAYIYTGFENSSAFDKVRDLDSTVCCSWKGAGKSGNVSYRYTGSTNPSDYSHDVIWGLPDDMYEKLFGKEKLITYMQPLSSGKGVYFVSRGMAKDDDRYKNALQYFYDVPFVTESGQYVFETLTGDQVKNLDYECSAIGPGRKIESNFSKRESLEMAMLSNTSGDREEQKWTRVISSFNVRYYGKKEKGERGVFVLVYIKNPGSKESCYKIRMDVTPKRINLGNFEIEKGAEVWLECGSSTRRRTVFLDGVSYYVGMIARETFVYDFAASEEAEYEYNVDNNQLYYVKPAEWIRKLSDSFHYNFYRAKKSCYRLKDGSDNEKYDTYELDNTASSFDIGYSVKTEILAHLLNNPDRIDLSINNSSSDVQKFETAYDYAKFLHDNQKLDEFDEVSKDVPVYTVWRELDAIVKELEDKSSAKAKEELEQIQTSCEEDINDLKDSVLDDQTYKRILEVASGYYKEFFSNKELQEKYIEDLLQSRYPIMAYPIFPEPVYYYLKQFSDKFILPCIEDIPNNSVAMFENDTAFVEAYLCGMNTEMGRELLWREYPTDQRGSYFKKFWDSETDVESIRKDDFFDVKSLHTWTGKLGKNHCEGKDGLLLFAIKGDLVKLYPYTEIFLHKATATVKDDGNVEFGFAKDAENAIKTPVTEAYIKDVLIVGFKITLAEALGSPEGPNQGYLLAFKQVVEDLAFKSEADDSGSEENTSAEYANNHMDKPSTIGRHVLTFLKKN